MIDRAEIYVRAGHGGNGCLSFRREKNVPKGGPDGGDGGDGGGVYAEAAPDVETLLDFAGRHHWIAGNGQPGTGKKCTGHGGKDVVLRLSVGTLIYDRDTGALIKDLSQPGERICLAEPGRGGRGNARFAGAQHQTPREFESGTPGQERWLRLELKLIADVGIIGLPNAGKSTLLARLSKARPRIAPYPFTTLTPQLGLVELSDERRFVMADIPGLIEGAHDGAGLGAEFLRHIERTSVLLHLVDVGDPHAAVPPDQAYQLIRSELVRYSPKLSAKSEVVAANKIDLTDGCERADELSQSIGQEVQPISAVTGLGVAEIAERLWRVVSAARRSRSVPEETSRPCPHGVPA